MKPKKQHHPNQETGQNLLIRRAIFLDFLQNNPFFPSIFSKKTCLKNASEFKIILYFCKQNVVFVHEVQSSGLTKHLQLTIVRLKSSNLV